MKVLVRTVAKFFSYEQAAQADLKYYRGLSPQQRVDILLELIENSRKEGDAASERLERVYRIVKLPQR